MKFQVKVEYGREKFVKFYVEADVVDGKVLRYSFSSLVEDITRQALCGYDTRTKMAILSGRR